MINKIENIYPMLPIQKLLYVRSMQIPSATDIVKCVFTFKTPLNSSKLRIVWNKLVLDNEILRTKFCLSSEKQFLQVTFVEPYYESFIRTKIKNIYTESIDMTRPIRLLYFEDRPNTLEVQYHRILLDGWSFQILIEMLFKNYIEDNTDGSFKMYSYKKAMQQVRQHIKSNITPASVVPCYFPASVAETKSAILKRYDIREDLYAQIQQYCKISNIRLSTFVYSSWAIFLRQNCQMPSVSFGITTSGRNILDSTRVLGNFICTSPLQADFHNTYQNFIRKLQDNVDVILENELFDISKKYAAYQNFNTIVVIENHPISETVRFLENKIGLLHYQMEDSTEYTLVLGFLPHAHAFTLQSMGEIKEEKMDMYANELLCIMKKLCGQGEDRSYMEGYA